MRTGRPWRDNDEAYKDDVAPDGSPFRPLYDDKIMFNGQPVALVVAETGRSRASRRRWSGSNTTEEPHVTDCSQARASIEGLRNPIEASSRRRSRAARRDQALAAAAVRHEAEYFVPIEHHNPMELYASTVILGGRRQAYGLRQDPGRAERAELSLRRVRHEAGRCARHVAFRGRRIRLGPAPAISGGAGGAGGARAAALGAARADAPADVCARLPAGDDPAHRARRKRRRHARRDHARRDHR